MRMYRVAISDSDPCCFSCSNLEHDEVLVGDYCPYCQYTYYSLTEVREYADSTISYHETVEEADAAKAALVPYLVYYKE